MKIPKKWQIPLIPSKKLSTFLMERAPINVYVRSVYNMPVSNITSNGLVLNATRSSCFLWIQEIKFIVLKTIYT